jgi:hypothetical protein
MPRQTKGIGAERVGFDDLRASLQIIVVDTANQIGLGKIQFVVATVDEYASGIEQRSHGAVAQQWGLLDPG